MYSKKAQADILSIIILTGVAIVIGIGLVSYYSSISSQNIDRLNLMSVLQQEYYSQIIRFVASDDRYAWFIAMRLDGSRKPFYIAIDNSQFFLDCSVISSYVYEINNDNTACSTEGECIVASTMGIYPVNRVNVLYSNDVIDLRTFLRSQGTDIEGSINICRVEPSSFSDVTWIRIDLGNSGGRLRIYLFTFVNNAPYAIRISEYSLGGG
ncbi:hypothetical protein Igag_1690 [Ignisphaera aggregans DSM 17230]|uniref:Uncharacterized protein n=1 Tax=Ignisphaera aggregans (strain DSM 17230 / JCM 13409 / AQ1.S1) TaxID=583356 RepID=E0SRV6_IGNAA|nr:hypothetical protein Igag_1690 [Ignisphaera aggregans DSM 17230]